RHGEALFDVTPRLTHAHAEVLKPFRLDPGIVLGPGVETLLMDVRREELGERGAHGFLPRLLPCEVHIGIDRKAHTGQHVFERHCYFTRETHRFGQLQPGFNAARIIAMTIVIEDALHPAAAYFAIGAVADHRAILQRNVDLIVEAVGDPELHLALRQLAAV